ncbi:glycoside hydrolase family 15 protein [Salinibacterium sp.]|uniref:glycoside hydrolase family 15 protein n=1 Tax=Salinibacterium sp. TaxID=1915057 RepID=UPI00286B0585|nr:glycoside hydrolase family 15 protein [Salinibacterium sp.]
MTQAATELSENQLAQLASTSFTLILSLQDPSGAFPASPTFSAYRGYSWFRDGAFIADGVSSYGTAEGIESASRFFDWCSAILTARADHIERIVGAAANGSPLPDEEMLATRFTFDGHEGTDDWWDFQLDGYGTWLWAAVEHAERHQVSLEPWTPAIRLTVAYLQSSWSRPCFDWWEENSAFVHGSTLGCIAAGLRAAARSGALNDDESHHANTAAENILETMITAGVADGHLTKWLGTDAVDASLLAVIAPLSVINATSLIGLATTAAITADLSVDNGVHRFLGDTFYGGGQWPLLSCMLGLAHAAAGDRDAAVAQLRWAARTATTAADLPEQVADHLLDPSMRQEWVDRWGTVATPLLWSHAMFIRLAVELGSTESSDR